MIALAIVGLMAALSILALHNSDARAGARGLATVVMAEFESARQSAIRYRQPVAVVLPTNGGSQANSGGLYLLEGETRPLVTRIHDYTREFRGVDLFVGSWGTNPATFSDPSATTRKNASFPGAKGPAFSLESWLPTSPVDPRSDYCFVFLPDGSVVTNDLPAFDNTYHVLVAAGVATGPAGGLGGTDTVSGSPPYHRLFTTGECYTLCISPAGSIRMETGLLSSDGSTLITARAGSSAPGAGPPPPSTVSPVNPTLVPGFPSITPVPNPATLPPNVDAVLTKDQYLTLEVQGVSNSGGELFCNWDVTYHATPEKGAFSFSLGGPNGGRMEWDASIDVDGDSVPDGAWRALWQWRPPPTAAPGDRYDLQAVVSDRDAPALKVQIEKRIMITPPGKVLFETDRTGSAEVWSMNDDGSRQQVFRANASEITADLQGSRFVYVRGGNLWLAFPRLPETEDVQLTTSGGVEHPSMSPSGHRIAYRRGDNIYVIQASPTNLPAMVDNAPLPPAARMDPSTEKFGWDPAGNILLYTKNEEIWRVDIADGAGGNPQPAGAPSLLIASIDGPLPVSTEKPLGSPSWGVDNQIFYINYFNAAPTGYDPYLFVADAAGNNVWYQVSYNIDEVLVERNPAGGPVVLEVQRLLPANPRQIVKLDYSTVPAGGATTPQVLTSQGSNTRPVWTR